jgi:hypothetical protein
MHECKSRKWKIHHDNAFAHATQLLWQLSDKPVLYYFTGEMASLPTRYQSVPVNFLLFVSLEILRRAKYFMSCNK